MPRSKVRSQHGGRRDQKNYKRTKGKASFGNNGVKKRKHSDGLDATQKKYKFIRRNQESEEASRQQRQLEKDFQEKNYSAKLAELDEDTLGSSSEEEIDPMQSLMSTLAAGGQKIYSKTNEAIESAESDSEMEGDDSNDESEDVDDEER